MFRKTLLLTSRNIPVVSSLRVRLLFNNGSGSLLDVDINSECKGLTLKKVQQDRAKRFMENLSDQQLEDKSKLEVEIEEYRHENLQVPEVITDLDWCKILKHNQTYHQAVGYLERLCTDEDYRLEREEWLRKEAELEEQSEEDFTQLYKNNLVQDRQISRWNMIRSLMSENQIIIDLNYPEASLSTDYRTCKSVLSAIQSNAAYPEPLNIHVTSVNNYDRFEDLSKAEDVMLGCHFYEKHFLDIFPREKLVYLSPDTGPMVNFDPRAIYIIGGYESWRERGLSWKKAKECGIRCVSFPLAAYCLRKVSAHSGLSVPTALNIIHSMYLHHCWKKTFKNCLDPERFEVLDNAEEIKEMKRVSRDSKLSKRSFRPISYKLIDSLQNQHRTKR
ncbi:tRNA methyltransferase 10 C [Mactra antiquata]